MTFYLADEINREDEMVMVMETADVKTVTIAEHEYNRLKKTEEELLKFVQSVINQDGSGCHPDQLWNSAKTVQDGIDYADCANAEKARAFLRKIKGKTNE